MISYDSLRLVPAQEARAKAGALLRMDLPVSARNLILWERMRLARSFDEFLRYAVGGVDAELVECFEHAGVSGRARVAAGRAGVMTAFGLALE